jgi:hypothetical protein
MAIQETPEMADWIKTVDEVLISHGTRNPCKVVREMQEAGQDKAPIFRKLVEACRLWQTAQTHLEDVRSELAFQRSVRLTERQLLEGLRAQGLGPLRHFEEALAARDAFISALEKYEGILADWLEEQ